MLAIDSNLIVRYLTGDHPKQSMRARKLIDGEDVFVCTTVLLETEWVLRSVYDYAAVRLAKALRAFAGLPHVTLEDAGAAARALEWAEGGLDFADALHLAKRPPEALQLAEANWAVQREPWDTRILLEAALAAGAPASARPVLDWLTSSQLEDGQIQKLASRLKQVTQ